MTIGHNKGIAIAFLVLGSFTIIVNLIIGRLGMSVLPGLMSVLVGSMYLTRPYFTVSEREIIVRAALGSAKKVYAYNSLRDLDVAANGKVYIVSNGERRKVGISRVFANGSDWEDFINYIGQA